MSEFLNIILKLTSELSLPSGFLETAIMFIIALAKAIGVLIVAMMNIIFILYIERKIMADMQVRYGPMRVGPHGILQPIADALKLVLKEDIIQKHAKKTLFILAPFLVFVPSFLMYLVVPAGEGLIALNLDIGIFFAVAVSTILPIGIIVGGWSSFNKYSLFGAMRSAAQQISYEVPLMLSFLGVIMLAGSMHLVDIVNAQQGYRWFIFLQPFAFIFYFIASLADLNRTPFDIPEAESELVQGFVTEYSSMKFALFFLAEYSNLFVISILAVLLFFGGWHGPAFLPPIVWFFLKVYALIYLSIWIRATLPRVRIDQLMTLGWKILLPLTLINIGVTGFMVVFWGVAA